MSILAVALALFIVACDTGLTGTYTSKGGVINQTMLFKSGGKVEVTTMGMIQEGEYEREGKKVRIKVAGTTTILTIDDQGCLDGGKLVGKFCKN